MTAVLFEMPGWMFVLGISLICAAGLIITTLIILLFSRHPHPIYDVEEIKPPRWCHLELFGHSYAWGLVSEAFYAGRRWVQLDVPELSVDPTDDGKGLTFPASTKLYHPNAIYALEERPQDEVLDALRRMRGLTRMAVHAHEEELWPG